MADEKETHGARGRAGETPMGEHVRRAMTSQHDRGVLRGGQGDWQLVYNDFL
jgi:hypothetical protein